METNTEKKVIVRDEQGNTWLVAPSALSAPETPDSQTVRPMTELPPLTIPKPPAKWTARSIVIPAAIFIGVFALILVVFNWPATSKAVTYTATHSEEKDNQQLTDQYRALYGFESHPELSVAPAQNSASTPQTGDVQLSIPKLNLKAPVLSVTSTDDTLIMNTLKKGVVIYPGSVMPGQSGQTVIIGHSSSLPPWTEYSAVFAKLGSLAPDDLIYLTVGGNEYIYRVSTVRRGSVQDILNSGITGDLILSTCWPVGTDTNRVAVSAVRIK
jgi:LPXTG-site transpeptidase (sortase) family protein